MDAAVYQRIDVKLGFATERSNETYLGLSDADFRASPTRRYAGSQRDLMRWERSQAQLSHFVATGLFDVTTTAYRHDFDRRWRKLNRFQGGPDLADVLANPDSGQNAVYAAILRGEADSSVAAQNLMIGTNHRVFVSQGIQSVAHARAAHGAFTHFVEVGARLHYDHIDRMHTEVPYRMTAGELSPEGSPRLTNVDSRASATAGALHATDELRIGRWLFAPGARVEWIETADHDRQTGERMRAVDTVVLPGLGAFVDLGKGFGLLAGANEGFSPVAPGQPDAVKPERSVNFEAGARLARPSTRAELIGFYNDYFNLTGECTFSGGCADGLNDQFNGGAVDVYGVEAVVGQAFPLPLGLEGRIDISWTWTRSSFRTAFESGHPQWGDVEVGDELPYVPEHLGAATWGVGRGRWFATASVSYVSAMREEAGQGPMSPGDRTDAHTIVDLAAHVEVNGRGELYLSFDNLFDESYIASRRPYGARPGKPREVQLGFKYRFGG
jgi:Fe(3+) dicitrate transport protein